MRHSEESEHRYFQLEPTVVSWWQRPGFLTWILLGIMLFLLTDSPVIGAVLPTIYAGSRSYKTALWLLQNDPQPLRARICCAFFVATAFWQGTACAFVNMVGFGLLSVALKQNAEPDQILGVTMALLGGILLTTIVGFVASIVAMVAKVRIWVNPGLRTLINDNLADVNRVPENPGLNYATFVLITSITVPTLAPWGLLLTVWQGPIAVLSMGIGIPLVSILTFVAMSKRIIARHPVECWHDTF